MFGTMLTIGALMIAVLGFFGWFIYKHNAQEINTIRKELEIDQLKSLIDAAKNQNIAITKQLALLEGKSQKIEENSDNLKVVYGNSLLVSMISIGNQIQIATTNSSSLFRLLISYASLLQSARVFGYENLNLNLLWGIIAVNFQLVKSEQWDKLFPSLDKAAWEGLKKEVLNLTAFLETQTNDNDKNQQVMLKFLNKKVGSWE